MKHTTAINRNFVFRRLYRQGKCYVTPYMAVYVKKTKGNSNRLGVTATKKIGNAVQRNRARRVIKEAYRLAEHVIPRGYDFVIVARTRATQVKMQEVHRSLCGILEQIK